MHNVAVVFDTNAYRDLSRRILPAAVWTVPSIGLAEQQRQITAYASPFVIMELASHLWDEKDPDYAQCRCGLTSLEQHCTAGNGGLIRILADSESLVAKMLFDHTPAGYNEQTERLCQIARAVAVTAPSSALDAAVVRICRQVADYIERREMAFLADILAMIRDLDPTCQGWDPFDSNQAKREEALSTIWAEGMPRAVAAVLVAKAAAQVGASCSGDDFKDRGDMVLEHCSATIALYLEILKRIAETGCDLTKKSRSNWIWDMQILLGLGEEIDKQRLVLVTTDGDVLSAARAALLGDAVQPLDEYLHALNS